MRFTISRETIRLIALLVAAALPGGAAAQSRSQGSAAMSPVGVWRGTSVCLVRPSACHDEIVVYRIAGTNSADSLTVDARKIVGGQEEEMGVLACRFTSPGGVLTCRIPHGTWAFRVRADSLVGELRLPDGTRFRDVRTVRAPWINRAIVIRAASEYSPFRSRRSPDEMSLKRMDNVGIVVESLDAVIPFFVELGMKLEGRATIEGEWAGRVTGLGNQRVEIAMLVTPDGHSRLELSQFFTPPVVADHRTAPVNALGYLRVMFAVSGVDDTIARLRPYGAELVGEVVQYRDSYRLCYIRGPEGLLVGLAEELRSGDRA